MKKSIRKTICLTFSLIIAMACIITTTSNAKSGDIKHICIDGVGYDLYEGSSTCEASLYYNEDVRSEIVIPSEVTWEGKTYKVDLFSWDGEYEEWDKGISHDYKAKNNTFQKNLKKITIGKGIRICEPAFNYEALEEVVFEDPEAVSGTIFYNCPKLKSIYIPKNVSISPKIRECPQVQITIDPANPYLTVIDNDIYSKDGKTLYNVTAGPKNYRIRNTVITIAWDAFTGNDQIQSVYIPDTVKKISENAFSDMKNLSSVRMSRSVKKLNKYVFRKSLKLKTITLPKNVKKFDGAFGGSYNCKLKKVYIKATSLKKSTFSSLPKSCKVYVKNNTVKKQVKKYGFKGKIIIK